MQCWHWELLAYCNLKTVQSLEHLSVWLLVMQLLHCKWIHGLTFAAVIIATTVIGKQHSKLLWFQCLTSEKTQLPLILQSRNILAVPILFTSIFPVCLLEAVRRERNKVEKLIPVGIQLIPKSILRAFLMFQIFWTECSRHEETRALFHWFTFFL